VIHNGSVAIPVGSTRINPQDRVVVFTLPKAIKDVEQLFS
jgi:trk system potassium uptake protein TrkA